MSTLTSCVLTSVRLCVMCTEDTLVRVMRCINMPVSHGLNSCTHASSLTVLQDWGVLLYLWEQRGGKSLKLHPSQLVLYQAFLSLLFIYFLILLKSLSLPLSHFLHAFKHPFSVSLICLSLCTSLLFYPPLLCHLPLDSLSVLLISPSLTSSHSSLIHPSLFCLPHTAFPAFPTSFFFLHLSSFALYCWFLYPAYLDALSVHSSVLNHTDSLNA